MPRKTQGRVVGRIRPATLARMNNEQLRKVGYIRIPGFTKKDGTKVKSHIRKLRPAEKLANAKKSLLDTGQAIKDWATPKNIGMLALDLAPVTGEIVAFKESYESFGKGDNVSGGILFGAGIIGSVPIVGDAAALGLKGLAKTLKAASKGGRLKSLKVAEKEYIKTGIELQRAVKAGKITKAEQRNLLKTHQETYGIKNIRKEIKELGSETVKSIGK